MKLKDKVAIVTGGAGGIGSAVAKKFLEAGAVVIAADLKPEGPDCERLHRRKVDVADQPSVTALVAGVAAEFGPIDVLVHCAGIGADFPFLDMTVETFDRVIAINLRGTFLMSQAVARVMAKAGKGSIINISSFSGLRANSGRSAYGPSKAGVQLLSQVMAVELAPRGVRVNVVAPGPVETPMLKDMQSSGSRDAWTSLVPQKRYAAPEEIANAILFIASDEASYLTGQVICVDGGLSTGGMLAAPVS